LDWYEGFFFGLIGGVAALLIELQHIASEPRNSRRRRQLRDRLFWLTRVGLAIFGGILVAGYLRVPFPMNQVVAMHVGATAPFFLGGGVRALPDIQPSTDDTA
jgi:hypothetical protein